MKYDVVKEYDWTSIPRGSGLRKRAPRVWVKSYKLNSNNIMTLIKGYMAIGTGGRDAKSFYEKMYGEVSTPEDDFNFPFFNDNVRSFSNTFGDTFQDGFGGGGGIGESLHSAFKSVVGPAAQAGGVIGSDNITEAAMHLQKKDIVSAAKAIGAGAASGGNPGTYIETPQFYQFDKSDGPLEVSFMLSNTITDDYEKNHKLVQRLTYINRPLRKDSIAVDPPRIFQVKVPGQRFIKWAYCSSFSVNLVGTKREHNGVILPEAYQITMSYQSLTLEHAGFLKEA